VPDYADERFADKPEDERISFCVKNVRRVQDAENPHLTCVEMHN